mmetsp:Transcript_11632/g.28514  ORF Transcript_11632/g.28514 Transcript_11632/m.28514 type:complete len:84 (-) Transcript_11632:763-1014(-)
MQLCSCQGWRSLPRQPMSSHQAGSIFDGSNMHATVNSNTTVPHNTTTYSSAMHHASSLLKCRRLAAADLLPTKERQLMQSQPQ